MISIPEVDAYLQYASEHPTWINKERWQLFDHVVKPVLARDDITFNRREYDDCIRYCEANFYPLFPYQKFIYAFVFLYEADGNPVFPQFVVIMGRGNGKDGFIMPLVSFLMTPMHGVMGYNVDICANSEDQANDSFDVVYDALTEKGKVKPRFKGKFSVTKTKIVNLATKSRLKYNTSNAKTKDGKKIGALVLNEIHEYENNDQINVFESAFGKIPRRREFIISTAGYVREGPYDTKVSNCIEILETGENPEQIFPFICRLSNENEIHDPENWHKANPSLEYMPNLQREIRLAYAAMLKDPGKKPEFLTKRCNLPAVRETEQAVTSWQNILRCSFEGETEQELERRIPRPVPDHKGRRAIVAIDYADIRDFASVGVLTQEDSIFVWKQKTWINRRSPTFDKIKFPIDNIGQPGFTDFVVVNDPVIPVQELVDYCLQLISEYDVAKIAMDTYRYTLFKKAFLEAGLDIEDRNNPNGMIRLIRRISAAATIYAPTIEQAFEQGRIIFGDSAIMRWYVRNTCTSMDRYGNKQFMKIEPKLRKNDGFMAFVAGVFCSPLLDEVIIYV